MHALHRDEESDSHSCDDEHCTHDHDHDRDHHHHHDHDGTRVHLRSGVDTGAQQMIVTMHTATISNMRTVRTVPTRRVRALCCCSARLR
jgi:hypothetical protein